jgi:eukaryotic-like serine/threonine-protein kinase
MDASLNLDPAASRVGATLRGKYRLDALLGVGGTSVVYRATHRNGHRVAVKMLRPHLAADDQIRTRFIKESYIANAVEHRCVVRVLDDDVAEDGAPFLVMELLEGESLGTRWESSGALPPSTVVEIMTEVLDVLATAHAKGIVHRDIKPGNIFLNHDGTVKVLDFGIARMRDSHGSSTLTRTGGMMGTPAFMPPEQAMGAKDVDARADIWAVGATMFALLSNQFVHDADTPEAMIVYTATRPARLLHDVAPEVPVPIAALVDRALAFEREDRFPTAHAMQQALVEAFFPNASKHVFVGPSAPPPRAVAVPTIVTPAPPLLTTTAGVASSHAMAVPTAPGWKTGLYVGGGVCALLMWIVAGFAIYEVAGTKKTAPASPVAIADPPLSPTAPTAPAAPPPPATEATPSPAAADSTPAPISSAKPKKKSNCDPPYVIDPVTHGRKVKPGC